jgi:acylphosphatase
MPVMGKMVSRALARAISGIVYNVIDGVFQDIASGKSDLLVGELTDFAFEAVTVKEEDGFLQSMVSGAFIESIELIKEQVAVQQWKLREDKEKENR